MMPGLICRGLQAHKALGVEDIVRLDVGVAPGGQVVAHALKEGAETELALVGCHGESFLLKVSKASGPACNRERMLKNE